MATNKIKHSSTSHWHICAALLLAPVLPWAQAQGQTPGEAVFQALDINEDGWLSGTELQQGRWSRYDTNANKDVSKAEFLAGYKRDGGKKAAPQNKSKPASKKPLRPAAKPVPKAATVRRQPGTVVGRCVNTAGQPLRGVRIRVFGVTSAGENVNFETRTKADGTYLVPLPKGNFHVGWAHFAAPASSGPAYALPLHPTDGNIDDQPSAPGIIENFVLKLSGRISTLKDAQSDLSYYGGSINVQGGPLPDAGLFGDSSYRFPTGSSLELTLTPQGALADGRPAKTLVLRQTTRSTGFSFLDVPIASYNLSAKLIGADGTQTPLRVAVARVGVGTSPIRFTPTPEEFASSGKIYFPSKGDSIPLLTYGGVSYAEVYVKP